MASRTKYNYVFLFYDVGEKRVGKTFKICKKYLSHFQKSVFRGELTPANQIKLEHELNEYLSLNEDFVCILKMKNNKMFKEKIIGVSGDTGETLII